MDFKKFEENVRMDLPKSLSGTFPHISVESAEVSKLQGMSYSGLGIRQEGSNVAMTIGLESFYQDYEAGSTYEEVLQKLTDHVVTHISQAPEVDITKLTSYEEMKPNLSIQMVERERNAEKLKDIPHENVEDMAIVYRFQMGEVADGRASILVTNTMMEHYGISQEQLHQDAMEMAEKNDPVSIKNMDELLYEMSDGFMGSLDDPSSPLFVATNESRFNGAAVMNY